VPSDVWTLPATTNCGASSWSGAVNRLHPDSRANAHIVEALRDAEGPIVAATDYMTEQWRKYAMAAKPDGVARTDGWGAATIANTYGSISRSMPSPSRSQSSRGWPRRRIRYGEGQSSVR